MRPVVLSLFFVVLLLSPRGAASMLADLEIIQLPCTPLLSCAIACTTCAVAVSVRSVEFGRVGS